MIGELVNLYQGVRRKLISSFAGIGYSVLDEAGFYDAGYMHSQIERAKKELNAVSDKLRASIESETATESVIQYRMELMQQRESLILYMIFIMSNSFLNLEYCVNLADGYSFEFMKCVEGLIDFHRGNKNKAFTVLEAYYKDHGSIEEHFLCNKVFGILLAERGQHLKAQAFLKYALQLIPDDKDCLIKLGECYKVSGDLEKERIINEIISTLE